MNPESPQNQGTENDSAQLLERVKLAQEAATAAQAARQQDIEKKLASIPELRAKQAELAQRQAEVAGIVADFEVIQAQRELIPEEAQAYEMARQAAGALRNTIAELSGELDKPTGDAAVLARSEDEARAENEKLNHHSELLKQYEQVKVDAAEFIKEVDAKSREFAAAKKARDTWEADMVKLKVGLVELIKKVDDAETRQKLVSLLGDEWSKSAEFYSKMAGNWQSLGLVVQEGLTHAGVFNISGRRALGAVRDYLGQAEHVSLVNTKMPDTSSIMGELMIRWEELNKRAVELDTGQGKTMPGSAIRSMAAEGREVARAERKKYFEEHGLTRGFDLSEPLDARERMFDYLTQKYEYKVGSSM